LQPCGTVARSELAQQKASPSGNITIICAAVSR
jgi:hypothetical protein